MFEVGSKVVVRGPLFAYRGTIVEVGYSLWTGEVTYKVRPRVGSISATEDFFRLAEHDRCSEDTDETSPSAEADPSP